MSYYFVLFLSERCPFVTVTVVQRCGDDKPKLTTAIQKPCNTLGGTANVVSSSVNKYLLTNKSRSDKLLLILKVSK